MLSLIEQAIIFDMTMANGIINAQQCHSHSIALYMHVCITDDQDIILSLSERRADTHFTRFIIN
jgi:hypothetical protein